LATGRRDHTVTLLPNGKVLVTGGYNTTSFQLASAEVYDPGTGTWAPTTSMISVRRVHTATLLPSGKVLVTGGDNGNVMLTSAEVYDPVTSTWASTASMVSGRGFHLAALLSNGKVLVAGGWFVNSIASAEVYTP
jgi:N-acetylneuraminic acid mutarotase